MGRGEIAHVIAGGIAVDKIVHIPTEEHAGGIQAAECDRAVEDVRAAQEEVDGVAAAHAGTAGQDLAGVVVAQLTVDLKQAGHKFLADIIVPALLHLDTRALGAVVVPALGVDAVHCEDLQPAVIHPAGSGVAHVAVLPVKEASALARENHDGPSGVAVDLELHKSVQKTAVLFVIADLHGSPLLFVKEFLIQIQQTDHCMHRPGG